MTKARRYLIQKTPIGTMMKPNTEGNWVEASDYDAALEREASLREELANHDSASLLMNAWVTEHKTQMPWDKAIELISVVTKMPDEEKQRLLCLDDQYELISKRLADAERRNVLVESLLRESLEEDDGTSDWLDRVVAALRDKPTESGASE